MMVALLLYGYAVGLYSSRRIAKACMERVDFMAIVALQAPDFRTISEFRRRHLAALSALFVQVLKLCERAGLVKLGHVALDGTKIKANASKHKAMSYERMCKRQAELQAEVDGWLQAAEAADAAEDKAFGADRRGDEMPDWVADKQARLAKIRQAKAELEAEAKAKAAAEQPARAKVDEKLKTKDGYIQAIMHKLRSTLTRRSSWRTRSATMAAIRTSSLRCSMLSRPIWAAIRTKYRPMQATARPPIFAR